MNNLKITKYFKPKRHYPHQFSLLLLTIFCSLNCLGQSRDISYMTSGGKLKPLQAIMDGRHYTINLDVDIERKTIKGNVEITLNLSKQTDTLLLDLVHLMQVEKIKVNNQLVSFSQKDDKIEMVPKNGTLFCITTARNVKGQRS